MSFSDSIFLFELVVEDLESYINYRDFSIVSQFADLFSLRLKNPHESPINKSKRPRKNTKRKKVRHIKDKNEKVTESKVEVGQSVLIANNAYSLLSSMRKYPLQLCLCPRKDSDFVLGSTNIPWGASFIDYLNELAEKNDVPPVTVDGKYNVFDEICSKRMATITMSVKLSCLPDRIPIQCRSLSIDYPQSFTDIKFDPTATLSTIEDKNRKDKLMEETGTIKTIYSGGKKFKRSGNKNKDRTSKTIQPTIKMQTNSTRSTEVEEFEDDKDSLEIDHVSVESKNLINENIVDLVKSDTDLEVNKQETVIKSKSYSTLQYESHLNTLDYIFGDGKGYYGNQVYCVGYFTVHKDNADNSDSAKETKSSDKLKFKLCESECASRKAPTGSRSMSQYSLDLPADVAPLTCITKCESVRCDAKKHRKSLPRTDDRILVDLSSLEKPCCVDDKPEGAEKVEQVVGGMSAKMNIGDDSHPCYCTCECRFGFTKKTTYCSTCGGYELVGDELSRIRPLDMPFPCPIFHKLVDKPKQKSSSVTESRRKVDDSQKTSRADKKSTETAVMESERDNKKDKKKKKDDRFKFNYGYQAPQIGHSRCAMPCRGTMGNVPKRMGWLWTAEDIPGMKFRPSWRPGATNKYVVRLLKIAKNPGEVTAKKRRRVTGTKRPLKRPLLVVHKKDGEYTVTMETMKTFTKQRALNQQPYEDKPVITYTIGRSEEENLERRKKKERVQRRLERAQREYIQSAFKDMCEEICLKTYQQALGFLPETEDPQCKCYPAEPGPGRTNLDVSCSCSEDSASLGSATDSDEWIVEFTPPNALFDPTYKGKKVVKVDNSSQYTYLDYKVKLTDRFGNPVPRFFTGPDGKQQCSDLGGFWGPDHKWLEINVDGFIAPDNRWAPTSFLGPNGEQVDAESGKFQAANAKWLVVGVDGYVDSHGKWRFYQRPRVSTAQKKPRSSPTNKTNKGDKSKKDEKKVGIQKSQATWSCFGDASPKELGKMGIMGHGLDRKLLLATLKEMRARGEDVTIPLPSIPLWDQGVRSQRAKKRAQIRSLLLFEDELKCRHAIPSTKGVVAMDGRGNKIYFKLRSHGNMRPKERLAHLTHQGISLSSFHVPCFHSFINGEMLKQQQRERIMRT